MTQLRPIEGICFSSDRAKRNSGGLNAPDSGGLLIGVLYAWLHKSMAWFCVVVWVSTGSNPVTVCENYNGRILIIKYKIYDPLYEITTKAIQRGFIEKDLQKIKLIINQ